VVAGTLPLLTGLAISRGMQDEARRAAEAGADLYISGVEFGRPCPVPRPLAGEIGALPGVTAAVPRIVGRVELGSERLAAVVVGLPPEHFPPGLECVEGRFPAKAARNELVVGTDLAHRLNLHVGSLLPPFYRSRGGERVSEVVGIFRSDVSLWQGRVVLAPLDTAAHIFDEPDRVTDVLVYCHRDRREQVGRAIRQTTTAGRVRVITREELAVSAPAGTVRREGMFAALSVLGLASSVLAVVVTSGLGLDERRREVGVLKATGWHTDEVLLRSLAESGLVAAGGVAVSVLLAFAWLELLGGYGLAGVFLEGAGGAGAAVPSRLTPTPALLAAAAALVVVGTGSLYPTWRASSSPPREAMR
jgi:ABC-type lipoprotein release transport system permease subunit